LTGGVIVKITAGLVAVPVNVIFILSEPALNQTHLKTALYLSGGAVSERGISEIAQRANKVPDKGNLSESPKTRAVVDAILEALSFELAEIKAKMPPEAPKRIECPFCAEIIPIHAIKCGFCGADLPPPPAEPPVLPPVDPFERPIAPKFLKLEGGSIYFECGYCSQKIVVAETCGGMEIKCSECGEKQKAPAANSQSATPQQVGQAQSAGNKNTKVAARPNYTAQANKFIPKQYNYLEENQEYHQKLKEAGMDADVDEETAPE
jgi:hypothetical protein